ncbi:MAG: PilZ domain-containing protein [Acidobacteriota bacterium]|nr:PilZ domain-containing protein [Acidobacteriota bacterium]
MPTLIDRLRKYIGDRRKSPRFTTHLEDTLPVLISLPNVSRDSKGHPVRLAGYTRDVSETGLGIIVQDVHIAGLEITRPGRRLIISLGLPSGPIEMQATTVRHTKIEESESETSYLIGVQIVEMNKTARDYYLKFLNTLK